jgi:CheY-like chemotaxis protein
MRHIRVLVAEDNEDHMFLTTLALQSAEDVEVEVIGVRDGVEAIEYLNGEGPAAGDLPDLMLLDLSMPRRSGLQVLADIKGDSRLSAVPVVVLTSSDQPDDVRSSYELGANSYVTKTGDLSGLVDYWIQTARLPPH